MWNRRHDYRENVRLFTEEIYSVAVAQAGASCFIALVPAAHACCQSPPTYLFVISLQL